MANVKLKSIFTKEDIYTVLQLLKALADGVDENDTNMQAQIDTLKTKIDTLKPEPEGYSVDGAGNVTIAGALTAKNNGNVEVGSNLVINGNELYLGGTKWLLDNRGKDLAIVGSNEGGEYGDSLVITHNDMFDGKVSILNTFQFVSSLPMTVAKDEDTFGMFSFSSDGFTIYFCGQIHASKAENRYYLQWGFGYSDTDSELFFCEDLGDGAVNYVENGQLYNDESVILSHLLDSNSADIRYSKATHQHTVLIKFNSNNTDVLAFTAMSSEHLAVKNLQDLKNAFGGSRIACTGGDDKGTRYVYLDTRLANPSSYTVGYIDATGFHEDESLGSLTGTGGLTIVDIVSEPK